jgi:hypothetical protein
MCSRFVAIAPPWGSLWLNKSGRSTDHHALKRAITMPETGDHHALKRVITMG